jgi:hypothetical protein
MATGTPIQRRPWGPTISLTSLMIKPEASSIDAKPRTVPALFRNGLNLRRRGGRLALMPSPPSAPLLSQGRQGVGVRLPLI